VIPTLNVNVNVQVNLVAVERTFMRVVVDGNTAFEGRVIPGTAYPFEAEEQIQVLVGSGAAIRIVYNGRDLGLLGAFGQVVSNIYLADSDGRAHQYIAFHGHAGFDEYAGAVIISMESGTA
jgi:hypothetical protein